jgi:ABC-2 type transport system permease protein
MLNTGRVRAALIIPLTSAAISGAGARATQVLVDATDSNTAPHPGNATQLTHAFAPQVGPPPPGAMIEPATRLWFTPGRTPRKFCGPGFMVLALSIFPTVLSALAMSREGEQRTILQVYVSSISAHEFLLGKILAGMAVGLAQCVLGVVLMLTVFGLDFVGDPTPFWPPACSTCSAWRPSPRSWAAPSEPGRRRAGGGARRISPVVPAVGADLSGREHSRRAALDLEPGAGALLRPRRADAFLQGGGWPAMWWAVLAIGGIGLVFYTLAWRTMRRMQVKA